MPPPPELDTQISAVTVYTDQALITRRGKLTLTGQERALTLSNLPLTVRSESVRVSGQGTVAVKLLGVQTERVYATEPVADRVAQLTHQIEQLEDQQRSLKDRVEAFQLQRSFIQSLSEKSVDRFSRSLSQQRVSLSDTGELLTFLGRQYEDLSGTIAQQNKEITQIDKHLTALHQQLQQVKTPRTKESYKLTVPIAPTGAGEFELEVTYVCDYASWQPLYDLRVHTADNCLHLTYLAEIKQTTGEDWLGVALTLSTAKPGLGTLPPKLAPWYIDVPMMPKALSFGSSARSAMPAPAPQSAAPGFELTDTLSLSSPEPEPVFAEMVTAEISNEGGVVTFVIGGNSDIPGDGGFHKFTIFEDEYPCQLTYVAMPKWVSFAYLQAIASNPSTGATLLPGNANIFRDSIFVGTTPLENIAPGQEFKLNLGIDEGLKIKRDLVERKVDKQLIGGQRRIMYAYRIAVTNLRDREASLHLSEQIPVSRNEQIKVKLNRSQPQIPLGEMGLLEWNCLLPPKQTQEIAYQFTIEHPPNGGIIGLDG
ncbi:MAG: mucoidy inhibitor MuiA family protein [Scytolyngbya sp. HA4215-MV1]|nr:mucoidy inhibitor MuiA family protein [Scytolyngbya sp. HA4215-MV1]